MKKSCLILVIFILILSCEKVDKVNRVCNYNDPLEDLPWLKELKDSFTNCTCQISIIQATYSKQTVFYFIMNDPLCDGYQQIIINDCSGTTLKTYTTINQTFENEVTNQKTLYTCKTTKQKRFAPAEVLSLDNFVSTIGSSSSDRSQITR
jgi:hypothetical protein